jgi:transcription initiation factor IIE alpha subunit
MMKMMNQASRCPKCGTLSTLDELMDNSLNCPECGEGISSNWDCEDDCSDIGCSSINID